MDVTLRNYVVLFSDCHNFSIVATVTGDRTLEFVDRLYRTGGECIVSHGGRIIKYIGDAMFALFPPERADDALRAAKCLRQTYATLIAELRTDVETEMEVGLSCGEVQEGIVGHETLRGFDIMGECVNETAFIGHHRGIAITDALRPLLDPGTELRPLPFGQPKWRNEPLVVWEVDEATIR